MIIRLNDENDTVRELAVNPDTTADLSSRKRCPMPKTQIATKPRKAVKLTEFDKVMMGLIHVSKKDLLASEARYKLERKALARKRRKV